MDIYNIVMLLLPLEQKMAIGSAKHLEQKMAMDIYNIFVLLLPLEQKWL